MRISILTVFPEMLQGLHMFPLVKRAEEKKLLELEIVDLKNYADGSYRHIDDSPYGGGTGMILRYPVMHDCLQDVRKEESHVVLMSPSGKSYTQDKVKRLSKCSHLILLCGHYEGVDERICSEVDEEISIGDYILSGGEPGAMIIVDSLVRLIGVIRKEATNEESFEDGLLEYPQYTKPREYNGKVVPEVLFSGNHEAIRLWRKKMSLEKTRRVRPDLLEKKVLREEEQGLLEKL